MRIKLLAVDIDGTLVTRSKELTAETKKAIQKFIKSGGIFVLATGRPHKGVKRYVAELNLESLGGYVISYNGSRIRDIKTGELLYKKNLHLPQIPQILAAAKKYNVPLTTYREEEDEDIAITDKANDDFFQLEVGINRLQVQRVPSLKDEIQYSVPKFLITGEPGYLSAVEQKMKQELTGVTVFRSETFFLEITPNGVDKGSSLLWLADYLGVNRNETMACGDGFNDVTMLKAAGMGVAMENAQEQTKNAADFVTLSNEDNGVAYAIRKFAI